MKQSGEEVWNRFKKYYIEFPSIDLALDISRMNFPDNFFPAIEERMRRAFQEMAALENGAIANIDEQRMVGHYWLRAPELAPTPEITHAIERTCTAIESFAAQVH